MKKNKWPKSRLWVILFVLVEISLFLFPHGFSRAYTGDELKAGTFQSQLVKRFYTIITGDVGGTYYPLGIALGRLFNSKLNGTMTLVEPTTGSLDNLGYLLQKKGDLAFIQSDTAYDAWSGKNPLKGLKTQDLRIVLSLYSEALHIIVRDDGLISDIWDFENRKISCGYKGSGAYSLTCLLFEQMEKKAEIINYTEFSRSLAALKQGLVDGVFLVGGTPLDSVTRAFLGTELKLLPIDKKIIQEIEANYPYIASTQIPKGAYKGQKEDIITIGLRALLASTPQVSDLVIEKMLRVLFENRDYLKTLHPKAGDIKIQSALSGFDRKMLHPGAERYFKSIGK